MKALIYVFSLFVGVALLFYPTTTISLSSGSPGGKTGSPSDNSDCTSCHSVLATTSNLTAITSNIPSSGYVPGITYTITASLNPNSPKNGFEVTCEEDATGTKTGTFFITNTNTTKLVNSGSSVTHKSSGNTLNTWSFDWEAPAQGTGSITFYGAFIEAGYPWASNIGDYFSSYSLSVQEHVSMPQTYVPDDNFESFLESNGMGNGVLNDDYVYTTNINTIDTLSIGNLNIFNLTGIEDFDSLEYLSCWGNQLTGVDLSNNVLLKHLECAQNQLTNLDLSQNISLNFLGCSAKQLTSLDLNNNIALTTLFCDANQLTNLDLSNNTSLNYLVCLNNHLTNLDVSNGNNLNMIYFSTIANPSLYCINVDDPIWSSLNWTVIDQQHFFSDNCSVLSSPQTYVPDDNFESFLESNGMGNGILNDDSVTTSNIKMVTQLYVNNLNINDLTGVEDFDSLKVLDCNFNPGLLNLDLSNNTALLSVSANQIWGTQPGILANINVSNCTNLQFLTCLHTQVTSLDVTNCPDLIDLNIGHNLIDSINVSNNTLLETIIVDNNLISSIDVTNNINITHLDISDNPNLQCADLRNGQNININGFYSTGNPNLQCINVDDSLYSTNNWTNISLQNYFSSNCPPNCANNNFNCADSLQVTDITIIPSTSTITIGIYNGYNSFLSYPHVTYTIDANGDTMHTGQLNSFGTSGLDTSWYSYPLSGTSTPTMPLSIYFVYTGGSFVSDTCLLTFNSFTTNIIEQDPIQTKEILKITDLLGRKAQPIKNTPLIYIYKNGTKEKIIILE